MMRLLGRRADFGYGNARLRARKARLLDRAGYEALLGKGVDGVLGALSSTDYQPEVESALTRFHGVRRFHEAVRLHFARSLEEMRGFYAGSARELVDLLLSRRDLHNVLTLLRGAAVAPRSEEALSHVFPVGAVSDALAREISRQSDLATGVQLVVRWRLPDPETAASLRDAWPEYERTEDFAALEYAVTAGWARRAAAKISASGAEGDALRRYFERETDEQNLLAALRLREALARGELSRIPASDETGAYLPGGSIHIASLDNAARSPEPAAAAAALAALGPDDRWSVPMERWSRTGNLVALQKDLESRRLADAVSLFANGDPLGIEIPIAYTVAKEQESRNLRLISEGAERGLGPEVVRRWISIPDEPGGEA